MNTTQNVRKKTMKQIDISMVYMGKVISQNFEINVIKIKVCVYISVNTCVYKHHKLESVYICLYKEINYINFTYICLK